MTKLQPLGLVGRCFITSNENYQGIVRGELGGGFYLVQYFSWIDGSPSTMAIVPIAQMLGWRMFLDDEELRDWMDRHPHWSREKPDTTRTDGSAAREPTRGT